MPFKDLPLDVAQAAERVASIAALPVGEVAGSIRYVDDQSALYVYDGSGWTKLAASSGGGAIVGPLSSTNNAMVRWSGTDGTTIKDSAVTAADTGEITSASLTASRALVSGASKEIQSSAVTATELGYVSGVTSAIQTQIDAKLAASATTDAVTEGTTNLYFTDERAQDAIGAALVDTATIDFTYTDATPSITADVKDGSITNAKVATGIDAVKIGSGAVSNTEFGYLDGVTSAIQTQIDTKQATVTGAATTITGADLTVSRALVANASGKVAVSAVTSTELGYVGGVTSAIQTQIDAKQASDATLTALAAYNTNGLVTQTAADTFVGRTLTAGSSKLAVTNGNGVAGNPTVDVTEANLTLDSIGGTLGIAKGGTGQTTAAAAFKALAAYSAKGQLPGYDGAAASVLAVGADGTVLTADTASTYGFKWSTPLTNPMTTAQDMIVGGTAGAATRLATPLLGDVQVASPTSTTVTMTIATPCVVTHTSHGLLTGDTVYYTTTGALATGVTASTKYFIVKVDANSYNLSTTLANALAGTKIATSGSQSGTHTAVTGGLRLPVMRGATDGAAVAGGYVGERLTATGSATAWVSATYMDGGNAGLTLTPGVWLVKSNHTYTVSSDSAITQIIYGVGAASGSTGPSDSSGYQQLQPASHTPTGNQNFVSPPLYVNISASTPYYPKFRLTGTRSGGTVTSNIEAIRIA